VDAVTISRQIDPHYTDRVVRAWLDLKWLLGSNALEMILGIVVIDWVGIDRDDLQRARRRRLFLATHSRRVESN